MNVTKSHVITFICSFSTAGYIVLSMNSQNDQLGGGPKAWPKEHRHRQRSRDRTSFKPEYTLFQASSVLLRWSSIY